MCHKPAANVSAAQQLLSRIEDGQKHRKSVCQGLPQKHTNSTVYHKARTMHACTQTHPVFTDCTCTTRPQINCAVACMFAAAVHSMCNGNICAATQVQLLHDRCSRVQPYICAHMYTYTCTHMCSYTGAATQCTHCPSHSQAHQQQQGE